MFDGTQTHPEKLFHDFMTERKWLANALGFGPSRIKIYVFYVGFIFVYFYVLAGLNVYGLILAFGEKALIPHALHNLASLTFTTWSLTTRVLSDNALNRIRSYLQSNCNLYEGEEQEEQVKIRQSVTEDIRKNSWYFTCVWTSAGFCVCIFFPVIQLFVVSNEEYEKVVDIANPYLPVPFYMPFSTRNVWGFAAAYITVAVFQFYFFGQVIISYDFYMSMLMQLRAQLQILNNSIRRIHKRAALMHASLRNSPQNTAPHDLYQDSVFQKCRLTCLRSNIQHHQLLLNYHKDFIKFGGSMLLLIYNIAALALAVNLYLITQNPSLNTSIKSCMKLLAEEMYLLYMCVLGEMVMEESSSLFKSLYSIPWLHFKSKSFNQSLRIFMICTKNPMRVKSLLIYLTASLESFGNASATIYKLLNIMKHSKILYQK